MSAEYFSFDRDRAADGHGLARTGGVPAELLTPRQHQVLAYLARGFTNSEIGDILECSEGTVKNHVAAILARLDVSNRTEAAGEWMRRSSHVAHLPGGADVSLRIATPDCVDIAECLCTALDLAGFRVIGGERGETASTAILVRRSGHGVSIEIDVAAAGLSTRVDAVSDSHTAIRQAARVTVAVLAAMRS